MRRISDKQCTWMPYGLDFAPRRRQLAASKTLGKRLRIFVCGGVFGKAIRSVDGVAADLADGSAPSISCALQPESVPLQQLSRAPLRAGGPKRLPGSQRREGQQSAAA